MEKNSLTKNAIYNIIYKMLNILFPLITSVYVARILKAESIGKVAAAQNIVSYFTMAASMGIPTYGVKLIAQFKVRSKESGKAFTELFIINAIFSIICSIVYYLFILNCSYFDGKELLYCVTGLNIVFNIINVDWFYQGIQGYGYIALRSFVIKCISLLFLVVFVRSEDDFIIYALISSGALVGNYIFNIIKLRKYIGFCSFDLNLGGHIKPILTLFAASIAAEVYVLADTTMLDIMCDPGTVGYYSMSMKMIRLIRTFVVAVSAVFLPQLSYLYHNDQKDLFLHLANKGLNILMTMAVPAAVGFCLIADDAIMMLYGIDFLNSVVTCRILAVSIVTVALSNYVGMQILVTIGKEKITTISTICGAIINIFLNCCLIPLWQQNGAAIASVITEAVVMIIQLILSWKYIKLDFKLGKVFISVCGMAAAVLFVRQLPISTLMRLALSCIVGGIVYILLLLLQKDKLILSITEKLRR